MSTILLKFFDIRLGTVQLLRRQRSGKITVQGQPGPEFHRSHLNKLARNGSVGTCNPSYVGGHR
jgi:hypothetical protein